MAKIAVFQPDNRDELSKDTYLKKIALGFDHVFLNGMEPYKFTIEDRSKYKMTDDLWNHFKQEQALYEYLIEKKVIKLVDTGLVKQEKELSEKEKELLDQLVTSIHKHSKFDKEIKAATSIAELEDINVRSKIIATITGDLSSRLTALLLAQRYQEEFYPILKNKNSFVSEGKKADVLSFALNDIPIPSADTSWEQIIDVREDREMRLHYLALTNWVNEVSNSLLTANEIKEKYEYLYQQYMISFERHKIKADYTLLEILAAAAVGVVSGNLPAALKIASTFFKIGSNNLQLRQEEGNLPGKEIAYIYHIGKRI